MTDERAFCDIWMDERNDAIGALSNLIAVAVPAFTLVFGSIIAPKIYWPTLVVVHGTFFTAAGALLLVRERLSRTARTWSTLALQAALLGTFASFLHLAIANNHSFEGQSMVASVYLVTAIGAVFLTPASGALVAVNVLLCWCLGTLAALSSLATPWNWIAFLAAPPLFAWLLQYRMVQGARAEAKFEYRARIRLAPAALVRASATLKTPLSELFRPKERPCVCIASDWRDYQGAAARLSSSELARALDDYYAMCEQLLHECVPGGNYFLDWIADELFVILFASTPAEEGRLRSEALDFATRLLAAKAAFSSERGVPKGIDVGIAAGQAFCGMIGPPGFCKAGALGEPAVRARRLQIVGKQLRKSRGDVDRIILGTDAAPVDFTARRLEADETQGVAPTLYSIDAAS